MKAQLNMHGEMETVCISLPFDISLAKKNVGNVKALSDKQKSNKFYKAKRFFTATFLQTRLFFNLICNTSPAN